MARYRITKQVEFLILINFISRSFNLKLKYWMEVDYKRCKIQGKTILRVRKMTLKIGNGDGTVSVTGDN